MFSALKVKNSYNFYLFLQHSIKIYDLLTHMSGIRYSTEQENSEMTMGPCPNFHESYKSVVDQGLLKEPGETFWLLDLQD